MSFRMLPGREGIIRAKAGKDIQQRKGGGKMRFRLDRTIHRKVCELSRSEGVTVSHWIGTAFVMHSHAPRDMGKCAGKDSVIVSCGIINVDPQSVRAAIVYRLQEIAGEWVYKYPRGILETIRDNARRAGSDIDYKTAEKIMDAKIEERKKMLHLGINYRKEEKCNIPKRPPPMNYREFLDNWINEQTKGEK